MIKDKIVLYKETPTPKPIYKFIPYQQETTKHTVNNNITEEFLEKELERAFNLGIEQDVKYKHKKIPDKTIEIIGFNLDTSKIFIFKDEANFILCDLNTNTFNCRTTMTISELLNDYIQI